MYVTTEADLDKYIDLKEKYPIPVNRFTKFFKQRQEWLKLYRFNLITRNNSNNISKAATRVLKNIILSRTKAYSVFAFLNILLRCFNNYLIQRLLKLAYIWCDNRQELYEEFVDKMEPSKADLNEKIDDDITLCPSVTGIISGMLSM